MKRKHTRQQIQESIAYWKKQLNESDASEIAVRDALHRNIVSTLKAMKVNDASNIVVSDTWTSPSRFFNAAGIDKKKFYVVRTGSSNQTSDVYVVIPNNADPDNPNFVGIEVKEDVNSHMFNPRLTFNVSRSELRYVNAQFDEDTASTPEYKMFVNILVNRAQKININRKLRALALMFNKGTGFKITRFPVDLCMSTYEFKKTVAQAIYGQDADYDKICQIYSRGGILPKETPSFIDFKNTYHMNDLDTPEVWNSFFDFIFTDKMSIPLGSYEVRDNEIVKLYFNKLRANSKSYYPVQYIQYGESMYKLVDDDSIESNFIRPNSPYKLLDYDDDFGGVRISWKLVIKDGQLQIRGDVKSLPHRANSVNVMDAQTFSVNIPESAIAGTLRENYRRMNKTFNAKDNKETTMKKRHTRQQIQESIAYWKKQLRLGNYINESKDEVDESWGNDLDNAYKTIRARRRPDLADKESATNCILKHNDELVELSNRKPKPTKEELIEFVTNMFKEEGLDTPWTRDFLAKMKHFTRGFDDALYYVWNARLKGQHLSTREGMKPWTQESELNEEDFKPNKYFVEMFKCLPDGTIDDSDSDDGKELKYYYDRIGLDRFFNNKADAIRAAKTASRKLLAMLNAPYDDDDGDLPRNIFTMDDYHVLAVVRHGDEYESDVIACFIDGKLSPSASIKKHIELTEADVTINDARQTFEKLMDQVFALDRIGQLDDNNIDVDSVMMALRMLDDEL